MDLSNPAAQMRLEEDARTLREMLTTKYWDVFLRRAQELLDRTRESALAPDAAGRAGSSEYRKGVYFGSLDIIRLPETLIMWVDQEKSRASE